jgi:hypothetical protein
MNRIFGSVAALGLLGLLSWFARILWHQQVEYRVDAANLLNCAVTLVVALAIGYVYSERASTRKGDNDLVLDSVREAKAALHHLHDASRNILPGNKLSDDEAAKLIRATRELSNALLSLEFTLTECKIPLEAMTFSKLKESKAALKDSLTDSPYPGPFEQANCNEIENRFNTMRNELIRVGIAINHRT